MIQKITSFNKFQEFTKKGYTVIKFWATWCGACTALNSNPLWGEFLEYIKNKGIKVGEIESVPLNNFKDKLKISIRGYPTIILFKNGKKISTWTNGTSLVVFLKKKIKRKGGKRRFKKRKRTKINLTKRKRKKYKNKTVKKKRSGSLRERFFDMIMNK